MSQKIQWNVNTRVAGEPAFDTHAPSCGPLEDQLAIAAAESAQAAAVDAYQAAVVDPANIIAGIAEVGMGVLGGLKDLGDAAYQKLAAQDLAAKLDGERAALLKKGKLPLEEERRAEHARIAAANLRALKQEDWALVKDGLRRVAYGTAFTVYDLASLPVDAARAVIEVTAAAGIKVGRSIGRAMLKVGRALERAVRVTAAYMREGLEDGLAAVSRKLVAATNGLANDGPRFKLVALPDHPAKP